MRNGDPSNNFPLLGVNHVNTDNQQQPGKSLPTQRLVYTAPQLVKYGEVRTLTQSGVSGNAENTCGQGAGGKKC